MRSANLVASSTFALLCCQTVCLAWMPSSSFTHKKRSVLASSHQHRMVLHSPLSLSTDMSTGIFDRCNAEISISSSESEALQDDDRIQKSWPSGSPRFGLRTNQKRNVISFALLATVSLLGPSVAHAVLSSTTLSATAASTTLMRPTLTNHHHHLSVTTWQAWALVAAMWAWQSAQQWKALPLLLSQGLQQSVAWYMVQLATHPVLTKSLTAGVIGVLGDCLAQGLEHVLHQRQHNKRQGKDNQVVTPLKYDPRRGLSILLDGVFLSGPLMHFGYEFLDHILPIANGGSGAALLHVLADSIFLDAIFVATTFIVTGRMEGYTFRQVLPQLRRDYLPALKASWATSLFLMPIEFVCFRFLPLSYRVLSVNFIDIVWDAVISFMAHRSRHDDKTLLEEEATANGAHAVSPVTLEMALVLQ